MMYKISHVTTYQYSEPAESCYNSTHLTIRDVPGQRCLQSLLHIDPQPTSMSRHVDYFGNQVHSFSILQPHDTLTVTATSRVSLTRELRDAPPPSDPWEQVATHLRAEHDARTLDALQFVFESTNVKTSHELQRFAAWSFTKARPLLEATFDLTQRIHREFTYDPKATTLSTPTEEVLAKRAGVCQDFAHLQIACLRSLGLACRYVSGYLRTDPRPGKPRMQGVDASHAWVSVYCPNEGWVDFDPTNGCLASDRHITLAFGRDFRDVSPVKGVVLGGGQAEMSIAVDVVSLGKAVTAG